MIKINLLPEEYRRKEKTSFKIFLATAAGTLVVSACAGVFAYIWFGTLTEVRRKKATLEENYQVLVPQAKYDDQLKAEKQDFAAREKTIKQIRRNRISWTRKLDQFIDVVNNNGDDERHLAWFGSLEISPGKLGKKTGFNMNLSGFCAGNDLGKVANLFDDIVQSDFFKGFAAINEPSGKVQKIQKDLDPPQSVAFPLKMFLIPGLEKKAGKKGKK